ncbi:MAG: hypothetical protein IPN69_12765 [Acidobacteria bacterium]|nr:hypothetical protein [Acidobacteriota bacterium]
MKTTLVNCLSLFFVIAAFNFVGYPQNVEPRSFTVELLASKLCRNMDNEATVRVKTIGADSIRIDANRLGRFAELRKVSRRSSGNPSLIDSFARISPKYVRIAPLTERLFLVRIFLPRIPLGRYRFRLGYEHLLDAEFEGGSVWKGTFFAKSKIIRVIDCN